MTDLQAVRYWAITLQVLQAIRAGRMTADAATWAARSAVRAVGDVAVVPIQGVITQRDGWYGTSTEMARAALRDAAGAKAVVLDIDSPGGSVYGVEELGAEIRALRATTPVIAVANSLAASAAYWIASQASEIYVTPSGEIGSVGVYGMHVDLSVALDQAGLKVTLVAAGEGKVEGNPYESLSEMALSDMTEDIERYYGMFVTAVRKGRSLGERRVSAETIRQEWGAWVYGPRQAVEIGMADHVGTIEDAVRRAGQLARNAAKERSALAREAEYRERALRLTGRAIAE